MADKATTSPTEDPGSTHSLGVLVRVQRQATKVIEGLRDLLAGALAGSGEAHDILRLPTGPGVSYRSDNVHPLFAGQPELHPDNKHPLVTAASFDLLAAEAQSRLILWPEVLSTVEDTLYLTGSPASEGLSRVIFGYAERADDTIRELSDHIDTPWRWELDEHAIAGRAARWVENKGLQVRPNWHLKSSGGLPAPRPPLTDPDTELLVDDYLLLTRMRNFLTTEAESRGSALISIGGTHGTGTRSFEVLLRDRAALKRIAELLPPDADNYQALIRVSRIKHGPSGSRPTQIVVEDVKTFTMDTGNARRLVQPRLIEWLGGGQVSKRLDVT